LGDARCGAGAYVPRRTGPQDRQGDLGNGAVYPLVVAARAYGAKAARGIPGRVVLQPGSTSAWPGIDRPRKRHQ
jgi:hypothetical protein